MGRRLPLALLIAFAALAALGRSAAALPDAVIAGIDITARDIRAGDSVPVAVRVVNRGDTALPPVPVSLSIDDEPYAQWRLPAPLAPGASATWQLTWTAARGSPVIVATADPFNDVVESNEANNSGFLSLGVAGEPEPSPWPVALAGLGAFIFGSAIAFGFQRWRRALRPTRYARRPAKSSPRPLRPPPGPQASP
jgi:hypothetical protein